MRAGSGRWDGEPVYVVFNPVSGRGRGARLLRPFLEALRQAGVERLEHASTSRAGEEGPLTEQAVARGFRRVAAVGGDGTWSHVADAILRTRERARLGLVPGGTGCDLARSLGIPSRDLAACARIVASGHHRTIDVGRVEQRHFLNLSGFGFDTAVIEDSWKVRWLSGRLLYLYCALRQLWTFPGFTVELSRDGGEPVRRELLMLVVANGGAFGGGFPVAPGADLADGRLDEVSFGEMGKARRLVCLLRLLRGSHGAMPEVRTGRAAVWRLRFESPPAYETDGEWNRARSADLTIETVPAALDVLVPHP